MFKMFIRLNRNFQIKKCPYSNANKSFKYIYHPKIFVLSHLIANNMQGKTVKVYSFSDGRLNKVTRKIMILLSTIYISKIASRTQFYC